MRCSVVWRVDEEVDDDGGVVRKEGMGRKKERSAVASGSCSHASFTHGAEKMVTKVRSFQNSYPSASARANVSFSGSRGSLKAEPRRRLTLNDHMRPTDEVKVVPRQERSNHSLAKAITNAPLVVLPIQRRIARITPEQIVEEAVVGNVGGSGYPTDVVHGGERGGETSMNAEDLGCDDGGDGEAVEDVDEGLPNLDVAATFALVVEAIDCW
jgi:hypothetical protein